MKIAWIGSLKTRTLRNRILRKGFIENNIELVDLTIPAEFTPYTSKAKLAIGTVQRALLALKKVLKNPLNVDFIFISYPSQEIFPFLSKALSFRNIKIPIIFDPFISVYYSYTQDYRLLNSNSIIGQMLYRWEHISLKQSDLIMAETNMMCDFFSHAYKISRNKFIRVFLGADDDLFNPEKYKKLKEQNMEKTNGKTIVSFIGEFIPSQGIEYILKAAELLRDHKDIQFHLIGGLSKPYRIANDFVKKNNLNNVKLQGYIPLEKVPEQIFLSDIQLGIFGNTPKAKMVISNKVVCAVAMGKPIITGFSKASSELFTHKESIYFTEFANSKALSEAIVSLHEDHALRAKLGERARQIFLASLTPKMVVRSIFSSQQCLDRKC